MSVRVLSRYLQKKAEIELNENEKRKKDDVDNIRNWLLQQNHLKPRTDDQWILSFLRGCKFSLQKTKEKLDLFYTMRSLLPEYFSNRDPFLPEIQEFLRRGILVVLPIPPNYEGPVTVLLRAEAADPERIMYETGLKVALMMLDVLLLENDNSSVAGQQILIDMNKFSFKYVLQITPAVVKKAVKCLHSAYPTRLQGCHYINYSPLFEPVRNIVDMLVSKKISERVHFHRTNNLEGLHQDVPLSILPKEYGGEGESIQKIAAQWKHKIESYRDWFIDDAKYRSNESKRLGKPKSATDFFGIEGSFRKLEID